MVLKDLIKKYKWTDIDKRLFELYPDQKKNYFGYNDVFNVLKNKIIKIRNNKKVQLMKIYIDLTYDEDEKHTHFSVYGKNGQKEHNWEIHWALELSTYNQWLNYSIAEQTLNNYSEIDIICHCLYEMTFYGYSENQITYQKKIIKKSQIKK